MAQILNNTIVCMVPYCAQRPLGWGKKQNLFIQLSLGKACPFTLVSHFDLNQLKVDSNELKVNEFQLKILSYQEISLKFKRKIN